MFNDYLKQQLQDFEKNGLKRELRLSSAMQGARIIVDGKEVLNFCSNNYLGLADDFRLCKAVIEVVENYGFGSGASRLVSGNMTAHRQLEKKIAAFKGSQDAIVFSTGYMANVGIIASLFGPGDIIFSDRFNHASIIDGILLSRAKFRRYPHCDVNALEEMLKKEQGFRQRCIVTDTVFSMDGDIAPLHKIVKLAKKYDCVVMIDEAHAFGVMGKNGKGLAEHFELEKEIDIQMGTFSKAAGSFGAYCCGSHELISFLINRARSFIYTTAMPPSVAFASVKAIEIIKENKNLRKRLWKNTQFLNSKLKELGFNTMNTQTPIIPVLLGCSKLAVEFSEKLFDAGIFISAIRPPTVPKNTARLRLTVTAAHRIKDLQYLIEQFKRIGKELCLS